MNVDTNSAISVDCAVFGFDGQSLKVLLIRRRYVSEGVNPDDLKLPGAMIMENETLPDAASRVLKESTGLSGINLIYLIWWKCCRVRIDEPDGFWYNLQQKMGV